MTLTVRYWTIRESTVNTVDDFQIAWLPPQAYEYISPRLKALRAGSTAVELEAHPYVGSLPLDNGDVLRILPRVGEKVFWRMLLFSEGLSEIVRREFDELTQTAYTELGRHLGSPSCHARFSCSYRRLKRIVFVQSA